MPERILIATLASSPFHGTIERRTTGGPSRPAQLNGIDGSDDPKRSTLSPCMSAQRINGPDTARSTSQPIPQSRSVTRYSSPDHGSAGLQASRRCAEDAYGGAGTSIPHGQGPRDASSTRNSQSYATYGLSAEASDDTRSLENGPDASLVRGMQHTEHDGYTSKHFRVKEIVGREFVEGDVYYSVRWKRSWVPVNLVMFRASGRGYYVTIDGKDWPIDKLIKQKAKKGILKHLVRWSHDTQEPLCRLYKALSAIEKFEKRPNLLRRVVSLSESLIDLTKILPQPEAHFKEAQRHIALTWPFIGPRNDIDLLPAIRQIVLELYPRADRPASRKTYLQLIDRPQVRRVFWNQAYILSGRHYECSPPKRNALLLQAVAESQKDSNCERCTSNDAPFAECVRDTSDESPWFNGGCGNCGAAESNSTCLHHHVGITHLERNGALSQTLSLKEINADWPSRLLHQVWIHTRRVRFPSAN